MKTALRPACVKCGRPSYGVFLKTPRCFPHMNDRRLSPSQRNRLMDEAKEKFNHLDVGLPPDMDPGEREEAWGHPQRDRNPARRAGLDR